MAPSAAHNHHPSYEHHPCSGERAAGTGHGLPCRLRAQRAVQDTFFVSSQFAKLRRGRGKTRKKGSIALSRACSTRRCMRWQERAARTLGLISRGRCRWQFGFLPSFDQMTPSSRRSTHRSVPRMAPRGVFRWNDVVSEGFPTIPSAWTTKKLTTSPGEILPNSYT